MKDARPIICVHKGDVSHLRYVFAQAQESNPRSDFILLGNSSNSYYSGIKHVNIDKYFQDARKFEKIYKHTNKCQPAHRELFFHQRWLILNEFLQTNDIAKAFNIDSDVLIFNKIEDIRAIYPRGDFTLMKTPKGVSHGGSSFIDNKKILQKLSDLTFEIYMNDDYFQQLLCKYCDGIGEMQILQELMDRHPDEVIDTIMPVAGKAMQDSMSNCPGMYNLYEAENCWNKVHWVNDLPYSKLAIKPYSIVQLTTLHMHGHCKPYIRDHIRIKNWVVRFSLYFNVFKYAIFRGPFKYANRYYAKLFKNEIFPGFDPIV